MSAPDTRPETRAEPVAWASYYDDFPDAADGLLFGEGLQLVAYWSEERAREESPTGTAIPLYAQPTQPDAVRALRERLLVLADLWEGRCPEDFGTPAECVNEVGDVLDACANDLRSALTTDEEGERRSGEERRKAPAGPYGGPRGGRRLRTRRAADRTPSTTDEPTGGEE